MSKYMKADEVIALYEKYHYSLATRVSEFGYALRELPTVDAEPVRHGRWVRTDKTDKFTWECSECGYGFTDYKLSYCYDCGCKMDEVEE